jgi:hypothetical protein
MPISRHDFPPILRVGLRSLFFGRRHNHGYKGALQIQIGNFSEFFTCRVLAEGLGVT